MSDDLRSEPQTRSDDLRSEPQTRSDDLRSVDPKVRRRFVCLCVLLPLLAVLAVVALGLGDYYLSPGRVVSALFTDRGIASTVVRDWRAPRVLAAAGFGVALGLSGAIFQTLTRNSLGSPDVIGFTTGSYTGALIVLTTGAGAFASTTGGALAGGLVTAVLIYVLAFSQGIAPVRLVIVGIAMTALLNGINTWLLLRADQNEALSASIWGAGSLSLVGWSDARPALIVIAAAVPVLALLAPSLRQLELGDDAAAAHGVRVEPVRRALFVVGVALVAVVTAVAGPITFVALAAPQIAARLCGGAGLPLFGSALVGGIVLLGADVVAQHALPVDEPVGVVTLVLGGLYLMVLMIVQVRRSA